MKRRVGLIEFGCKCIEMFNEKWNGFNFFTIISVRNNYLLFKLRCNFFYIKKLHKSAHVVILQRQDVPLTISGLYVKTPDIPHILREYEQACESCNGAFVGQQDSSQTDV